MMFKFILLSAACISLTACGAPHPWDNYVGRTADKCQEVSVTQIEGLGFTNVVIPSVNQKCYATYFLAKNSVGKSVEGYIAVDRDTYSVTIVSVK